MIYTVLLFLHKTTQTRYFYPLSVGFEPSSHDRDSIMYPTKQPAMSIV